MQPIDSACEHAAAIAFAVGDPDTIGEAYIIALRSPDLSPDQVRRAAEINVAQDTVARQRKRRDGSRRHQFAYDEATDNRPESAECQTDLVPLAEQLRGALGELAEPIEAGLTQSETSQLLGVSIDTIQRRTQRARLACIPALAELNWRNCV